MPADVPSSARRLGWPLFPIFTIVLVNFAGFSIIIPLLPFYGRNLHASPLEITLLFAAYSFGGVFGELYWGRFSDRLGRRRILIGTTACVALSYVVFTFVTHYWLALMVRVITGFFSGTMGVCSGYIADITRPEQRAASMGKLGAAINLGFAIGPAVGGMLATPENGLEGFRAPMLLSAAVAGGAAIWSTLALSETNSGGKKRPAPHWGEAFRYVGGHRLLLCLFGIAFIGIGTFASMEAVFGLWTSHNFGWSAREVGMTFIAVGMAGFFVQLILIAPATRRFGEGRVIVGGLLVLGLSMLLQPILRTSTAAVILMAMLMCGHSIAFPSAGGLISRVTPGPSQGSVQGVLMATNALSRICLPPALGFTYEVGGPDTPYFVCAALIGIAIVLGLKVISIRDGETNYGTRAHEAA